MVRRSTRLLVLAAAFVCGCGGGGGGKATNRGASAPAPASTTAPSSPACRAGNLTPAETEGPYYKEGSPTRERLAPAGSPGRQLILTGQVRARDCRPVAHALLRFWQADASGQYDNSG